jgi:hypothetical protein
VRAFGEEFTGPVLDDFELALGTRRISRRYGRALRSWMSSASPRGAPAAPDVVVPVGQLIRFTAMRSAVR